jgi:hypothetical protein
MLEDGKDRGIEFYEFLRADVRETLILLNKKPPEEPPRPPKRLRLDNSTPGPQELAYADKLKLVTFALTGEYRSYLAGLRDTAL